MLPFTACRTTERIPLEPSRFIALVCSAFALSLLVCVIDEAHAILDIDMKELMQAAMRITKKVMKHAVKQIFLRRIQLGSIMNGSSSSYVKLVVIELLMQEINEIRLR